MTKADKLIEEIKKGKRISADEADKVLKLAGYKPKKQKSGTRHQVYTNGKKILVILLDKKEQPNYIIRQIQEILEEEGL
jgi:ATP phosphoribosyltransferase